MFDASSHALPANDDCPVCGGWINTVADRMETVESDDPYRWEERALVFPYIDERGRDASLFFVIAWDLTGLRTCSEEAAQQIISLLLREGKLSDLLGELEPGDTVTALDAFPTIRVSRFVFSNHGFAEMLRAAGCEVTLSLVGQLGSPEGCDDHGANTFGASGKAGGGALYAIPGDTFTVLPEPGAERGAGELAPTSGAIEQAPEVGAASSGDDIKDNMAADFAHAKC